MQNQIELSLGVHVKNVILGYYQTDPLRISNSKRENFRFFWPQNIRKDFVKMTYNKCYNIKILKDHRKKDKTL
jgi:hypothetical protein